MFIIYLITLHSILINLINTQYSPTPNALTQSSQSQPPPSLKQAGSSGDMYLNYNQLIDISQSIYSSQIIIKAKAINKVKLNSITSSSPSTTTTISTTIASYSILFEIETIYKNNQNKNLILINKITNANNMYSKVFIQNATLPIYSHHNYYYNNYHQKNNNNNSRSQYLANPKLASTSSVVAKHFHHNSHKLISDIQLNKSYILFLNRTLLNTNQRQVITSNDFYTLINIKANRYVRERVPKLYFYSNPIEWNFINENLVKSFTCDKCVKSAHVNKITPEIQKFYVNDKVKINCTFEGNPLPYIKWSKYNETINLNDKRFSIKTNRYYSIFEIENVNFNDRGDYYCIAYNYVNNSEIISFTKVKIFIFQNQVTSNVNTATPTVTTKTTVKSNGINNNQPIIIKTLTTTKNTAKTVTSVNKTKITIKPIITTATTRRQLNSSTIVNIINKTVSKIPITTPTTTKATITTTTKRLKFIEIDPKLTTTVKSPLIPTGMTSKTSTELERKDIDFEPCDHTEKNKCHHGGQCFRTKHYRFGHQFYRQYCICKRGYEGKHCEIESIGSWFSETDVGRIPSDLKILYEKIQPKTKSKLMNKSPKKIIK